jgi:hypothetical protein
VAAAVLAPALFLAAAQPSRAGACVAAGDGSPAAVVLEVLAPPTQVGAWPKPCGIAVPPGLLRPGERLALFERGGSERPARIVPWSTTARGEPRLVRVELDELPRDLRRLELRSTSIERPSPKLRAERDGGSLFLRGSADDGSIVWSERALAVIAGATRLDLELDRCGLADDGEERRPTKIGPARTLGPDSAGFELTLPLAFGADGDHAGATVELRLTVAPSAKLAELEVTLVAPRELLLRGLALRGRVTKGSASTLARGGREVVLDRRGTRATTATGPLGAMTPDDAAVAAAPLTLEAGEGGQRVQLHWPDFGLARPSGATLRADGVFALDLVAEPLLVHEGQTVRRTLRLARGDRCGRLDARPFVVARGASGLDEETRAWLAPWKVLLKGWLAKPARIDDRGCYAESWGELANGEYDLGGGLLWLGQVERDAEWLACGEAIAQHTLDFDVGPTEDAPRGLFLQHGPDHASGKVEAGHQWIGGALGVAEVAGRLRALDAVRGVVAGLSAWRQKPGAFAGPERRLGWPVRAAAVASECIDEPAARELGLALLRDLSSRQRLEGFLDGDRRPTREGARVWVNTWVSLGVTVDALLRAERAWPKQGALDAAVKLARFCCDEGLEQSGLREVLLVDPDLGVVMEKRGGCRAGNAALAASGIAWLAQQGGDVALASSAQLLRQLAREDLASPKEKDLVELAKALLALQFEVELRGGPAAGQSLSSPSSVVRRPRENR